MSKDFTNEAGPYGIPARFRPFLHETSTIASAERTRLNIRDAEGVLTLLYGETDSSKVSGGTQLGIDHARELGKREEQLCFVDLGKEQREIEVDRVYKWIKDNRVEKCLIGGPRESEAPGIEKNASAFLDALFRKIVGSDNRLMKTEADAEVKASPSPKPS